MKEQLILESPAKINLRLEILGKRGDGYHELKTIFQKITLHDTLRFSLKKGRGISIRVDHPDLPVGKKNLIHRAAQSIFEISDYREGVEIEIEKKIPVGAGLGGGSSNAATTLIALNRLLKRKLSRKELMRLGVEIGADVPFFFLKGAALASGIGERLKKIEVPDLWLVLIYPNFEVSTRWAYQNFDNSSPSEKLTKQTFHSNLGKFLRNPKGVSQILFNDLEAVVSKKYPQVESMKNMLSSSGAIGAMMTGSGPTVFGIFSEERSATKAYEEIRILTSKKRWAVFKAHSVTS